MQPTFHATATLSPHAHPSECAATPQRGSRGPQSQVPSDWPLAPMTWAHLSPHPVATVTLPSALPRSRPSGLCTCSALCLEGPAAASLPDAFPGLSILSQPHHGSPG